MTDDIESSLERIEERVRYLEEVVFKGKETYVKPQVGEDDDGNPVFGEKTLVGGAKQ